MSLHQDQRGFSYGLMLLLLCIVLGVTGFAGLNIYRSRHAKSTPTNAIQQSNTSLDPERKTFTVNVSPYVGGGCDYTLLNNKSTQDICIDTRARESIIDTQKSAINKLSDDGQGGSFSGSNLDLVAVIDADVHYKAGERHPSTPTPQSIPTQFMYIDKVYSVTIKPSDKKF